MKDAGGGTYGAGETSSTRSMTLRLLLKEMAKKYDQYDDYAQQDSHELLRHLLDSMEMEEKDAIKRLQPMPPLGAKRRRSRMGGEPKYISPLQSPLPSPGVSSPPSPIKKRSLVSMANPLGVQNSRSSSMSSTSQLNGAGGIELPEIPESARMVPFADVLFGGSLASVVVCENCKSVSHLCDHQKRADPLAGFSYIRRLS